MHKNEKSRVLVVSDSLGTPIHARGIFNFTFSVVEMMRDLGCHLTLLVEPPKQGIIASSLKGLSQSPEAKGDRLAALADVLKHFSGDRFRFDWNYSDSSLQRFSTEFLDLANLRLSILDKKNCESQCTLKFEREDQGRYQKSDHYDHLFLFDSLLTHASVYSESFRRANLGLKPVTIDASGFDFVYIDTPHYVDCYGIEPEKVVFVAHDFIPYYDTTMGFDWRNLFAKKMETTNLAARKAVFNSKTTEKDYQYIFGSELISESVVIYPPNRAEILKHSENLDRARPSQYIADVSINKQAEFNNYIAQNKLPPIKHIRGGASHVWDGNLPYACSILSDEPRKNIQTIVDVSRQFIGKLNFVIMGQIDGNRYMKYQPENFPNVHFTGFVSENQKYDLLRATSMFIFPSLMEGFGIPIVEAASFGAPILCADTPVFREITFGLAVYFDGKNVEELGSKIEEFLDKENGQVIGAELQELVKSTYSQAAQMSALAKILDL